MRSSATSFTPLKVAQGQILVILTMRADFYPRCAADAELAAAFSDHHILVGPMTEDELHLAIERPAKLVGCELESGLVDLLMQDVRRQAGALPLLQHALLEVWNKRYGRRLSLKAYKRRVPGERRTMVYRKLELVHHGQMLPLPARPARLETRVGRRSGVVFAFPKTARSLNGMCLIAPKVLLVADSFAGQIWRVDLDADRGRPQAREWLAHESMGYFPGALKPEQPGVNGVRFAAKTNALYYTAMAKKLLNARAGRSPDP